MTQQKPTKLPLLRSESPTEFLELRRRLNQKLKPQDVMEEKQLDDMAALMWEVERLRRLKISTIQLAYGPAARNVLNLLAEPKITSNMVSIDMKARELAQGWLENDPAAKEKVVDILRRFDLDESAIEAEAMKLCVDHLQYLDRSLAMASARRDKTFPMLKYCRDNFADEPRQESDQVLNEPQEAPALDSSDAEQKAA